MWYRQVGNAKGPETSRARGGVQGVTGRQQSQRIAVDREMKSVGGVRRGAVGHKGMWGCMGPGDSKAILVHCFKLILVEEEAR